MKKTLLALLTLIILVSCNETGNEGPAVDPSNKNANTGYAGKYATRIEIPAIESGDLFLSHTTTRNGKENVTYSIAHILRASIAAGQHSPLTQATEP